MNIQPSQIASSLSEKFQLLHDAFADLAADAAQFHSTLEVQDESTRSLFGSLSRILAFSDHVHVALNLMGEDVLNIETAYGDPLGTDWNDQLQDSFDDWFMNMNTSNLKVN